MPLTGEQHRELTALVVNSFDPQGLDELVTFELGLKMFEALVPPGTPHQSTVFNLLDSLDRRGLVTLFLKAVLKARPLKQEVQDRVPKLWPQVAAEVKQTDVGIVEDAVVELKNKPDFDPLVRKSATSLRALSENISLLQSYKELHDCLHHLQMQILRRLGLYARRLGNDPEAINELGTCVQGINSYVISIDAAIAGLPGNPPSIRKWESDWLSRLRLTAERAAESHRTSQSSPGLLSAQMLRRILRQEPPRIDRYLRITAESIDLVNLASLFQEASDLRGSASEKAKFDAAKGETESLSIRLRALVYQHTHWQEIDAELWDADDYMPRTPFAETSDFTAYWDHLQPQVLALTNMEPSEQWAQDLFKASTVIEAFRQAGDWPQVETRFRELRQNATARFFKIDTDLKILTKEVGKIGDSLKELLTGL